MKMISAWRCPLEFKSGYVQGDYKWDEWLQKSIIKKVIATQKLAHRRKEQLKKFFCALAYYHGFNFCVVITFLPMQSFISL
jgi:hypothetical protein